MKIKHNPFAKAFLDAKQRDEIDQRKSGVQVGTSFYSHCHSTNSTTTTSNSSQVPISDAPLKVKKAKKQRSTPYEKKTSKNVAQMNPMEPVVPQLEYNMYDYEQAYGAHGQDPLMPQNPATPPQLASISSMLDWNTHPDYYVPQTSTPQPINPNGSPLPAHLDSGSVGNLTGSPTSSHLSYENGK